MSGMTKIIRRVIPLMLLSCSGIIHAESSQTASADKGTISMQGAIINTPCAIATQYRDQTIEMGEETIGRIFHDGHGRLRNFSVNLVNCYGPGEVDTHPGGQTFRTTFDGPSSDGLFKVSGAEGVGLQIKDSVGNIAVPGFPLPLSEITTGNQRLDFTLQLVRNRQSLRSGEYFSALRFKIEYF